MIRVQRVITASKAESWTVVGDSLLPIAVVDEFLAYCTAVGRSPLTVETYAYALATLFRFLGGRRLDWRELTLEQAARFVECLQRPANDVIVLLPQVGGHGHGRKPATVNKITAAMTSFYDYHAANGVEVVERITLWRHIARRRYKPFLHHATKGQSVRRSHSRVRQPEMLPKTVTPAQVQLLLGLCASHRRHWAEAGEPPLEGFIDHAPRVRNIEMIFSVLGLPPGPKLELQFVLQQRRDAVGAKLRPIAFLTVVDAIRSEGPSCGSLLDHPLAQWERIVGAAKESTSGRTGSGLNLGFLRWAYNELEHHPHRAFTQLGRVPLLSCVLPAGL